MKETWGKPAEWVDYSGVLDGEKLGVALFDSPESFHHPARWHVRDYGLLAINPFGSSAFDPKLRRLVCPGRREVDPHALSHRRPSRNEARRTRRHLPPVQAALALHVSPPSF